jgi:hypothetical protein
MQNISAEFTNLKPAASSFPKQVSTNKEIHLDCFSEKSLHRLDCSREKTLLFASSHTQLEYFFTWKIPT